MTVTGPECYSGSMSPPAVRTQQLPDETTQWTVGSTVSSFRRLSPGVVYVASSGPQVFIPELAEAMEREIAQHGSAVIFVNMLEAKRLDGEARDNWATWSKRIKDKAKAHFLVRSKLVEMGLSLIAMIGGADMRNYSDPARFEAAMREAAPNAILPQIKKVA
jgi:hypothetical protein